MFSCKSKRLILNSYDPTNELMNKSSNTTESHYEEIDILIVSETTTEGCRSIQLSITINVLSVPQSSTKTIFKSTLID